ncbi:MAG: hypothetical protein J6330_12075 [Clostridia bacterium]|nr:hypothetical protein [Clostridia bacterium]
MKYESSYGKEELIRRWDEITSPARFAGANEQLDWVYNASRKGDSVRLVKKPRASYDPYATVFRGKIEATKTGSRIRGIFTKGAADYIITAFVAAIYLGVCIAYAGRAADKTVPYLLISAGIAVFIFLLTPLPGKRRKYGELIREVVGKAPDASGKEKEAPEQTQEQQEQKEKYKFRLGVKNKRDGV